MSKKRKFNFPRFIVTIVFTGFSAFLIFSVVKEVSLTFSLNTQLKVLNEQLALIEEETNDLKDRKEKLLDPDYLKSYARGEYSITKEGEQVFRLPSEKEKEIFD